jgi:hypothetical protein
MEKNKWISNKIKELKNQGKNDTQAKAIAFSMYENMYQDGVNYYGIPMNNQVKKTSNYWGVSDNSINPIQYPVTQPNYNNLRLPKIGEQEQSLTLPSQTLQNPNTNPVRQNQSNNQVQPVVSVQPINKMEEVSQLKPAGVSYGTPKEQLKSSVENIPSELSQSVNSGTEEYIQPNENIQFFNPYAGVDIPTAASTLGSSIENKDTLGTVASSLKLTTGLARNFFGGMGVQRRNNQVMKDYNEKVKGDLNKTQTLQDGGNTKPLTNSQVLDMNSSKSFGGLEVTQDFGKSGYFVTEDEFDKESKGRLSKLKSNIYEPTQGFSDITKEQNRYLDNGQGVVVGDSYKIWKNKPEEFLNNSKTPKEGKDFVYYTPKQYNEFKNSETYKNNKIAMYQDGGEQQSQQMQQIAQALQQGANPEEILKSLVEQGMPQEQAVQIIQTIMQQIQGQEQQTQMPEQQQGQFMQDGGKMTKALTGEYMFGMDEENPISKPNAEIEGGEYVQHPTGELQKAVGNTHENGGMDVTLEDNTKVLSDHLKPKIDFIRGIKKEYDIEVKSSDTYSKILDKYSKKIGLTSTVEEQEQLIKKLEKVTKESKDEESLGLNTQYLSHELKELEDKKKPLEEARKELFSKLFGEQEKSKPKDDSSEKYENGGNHFDNTLSQLALKYEIPEEDVFNFLQGGGKTGKNQGRFDDRYREIVSLGYNGSKNIGEMQSWMVQNYPQDVVNYFTESNQPMTAKHVDIVKDKYRNAFKISGISPNKDSASYTTEEKGRLRKALGENANKDFWLEGFNDNKQDWRFPMIFNNKNASPVIGSNFSNISAPQLPNYYQEQQINNTPDLTQTEEEKIIGKKNLVYLPDQNPMMPDSLQSHLKINRRYDRLDPALVSSEQSFQEINRQSVAAKERINMGAGAERISGELALSSNTQDNINKIATETKKINSQIISGTDSRNATIQATEENAAAQDALSYEQRQLTAKAKTDFDINNYYNTLRENNIKNYNKINELNLMNQLYPDFQFDGQSVQKTSPNVKFNIDSPVYKADTPAKKKKKYGGRFKK